MLSDGPSGVEALVERARAGDRDAFGQLYARFDAPIRWHLTRRVGDPEAAADLAQDTWERVWRKLPTSRPDTGSTFQAWLYRVATNLAMDAYSHATVLQWLSLDHSADWQRRDGAANDGASSGTGTPDRPKTWADLAAPDDLEATVLRDELRLEVRAILAQLQPRYRQILELYAVLGASYGATEEAGAILGVRRELVKNVLFRARKEYRRVAAGIPRSPRGGHAAPAVAIDPAALRTLRRIPVRRDAGSISIRRDGRPKPYLATCGRRITLGHYATLEEATAVLAAFRAAQEAEVAA